MDDFLVSFLEMLQVTADLDEMLERSLGLIVSRFGYRGGVLVLFDPVHPCVCKTGEGWRGREGEDGLPRGAQGMAPSEIDMLARLFSGLREPTTVSGFMEENGHAAAAMPPAHRRFISGSEGRAVLVPLRHRESNIGLIKLLAGPDTPPPDGESMAFLGLAGRKMGTEAARGLVLLKEEKLVEEMGLLRRLGGIITSELALDRALDSVIRMSMQVLGIEGCTVLVPEGKSGRVSLAHSLKPDDPKVVFAAENRPTLEFMGSASREVFEEGKTVYIEDATTDPRANNEFARRHGIKGIMGVPATYKGEVLAGILVEEPPGRRFTPDDIRVMEGIADFAAVAIANARLYRESRDQKDRLGELMRRLAGAQEEERARISRELHDSMASTLLEIIYRAEALLGREEADEHLRGELQAMLQSSRSTLAELRRIITDLRPSSVEVLGLPRALATLLDRTAATYGLKMQRDIEEGLCLDSLLENSLYRLAQEALNNVCRHAAASRVEVSLRRRRGSLLLRVNDDGRGFDPAASPGGMGLIFMRERAELLGGSFRLESAPGQGTTLTLEVPLQSA
jgi:signal transduction histidine kinase